MWCLSSNFWSKWSSFRTFVSFVKWKFTEWSTNSQSEALACLGFPSIDCFFFFFFFNLSIYLFLAALILRFCARAFSSCGKRGPLFIAVHGPLTIAASLTAEHRLQTRRLSNCGSRAQLLRGMWDLLRPWLEPLSPALAGGFSTTAPPGKPFFWLLNGSLLKTKWRELSVILNTWIPLQVWSTVFSPPSTLLFPFIKLANLISVL